VRPSTIYRLREAVKNPAHDRRCKYGSESIAEYPADTMIRVYTYGDVRGGDPDFIVALMPGGTTHCHARGFSALVAAAEEDRPRTAAEALFVADVPGHCADEVLGVLLREGRISVHHIMDAAKTVTEGV
jgi:hypothetical protein